jgi:membrane-associated phospholipid phosphatase
VTVIAAVSSTGSFGAALVILAGVAGLALIAAIGTWSGRRSAAVKTPRGGPVATARKSIAEARDAIACRTHPLVAAALMLILGTAVALVVTYAFGRMTKLGMIVKADHPVDTFVDTHRVGLVSRLMLTATQLGSYTVDFTIAVTGGLLAWVLSRRWLPFVALGLAIPTEIFLQQRMDALVHGAMPAQSVAIGPPGPYFSGGSARTLIVCGLLAYFVQSLGLERRQRARLWTLVALAAFLEGYSRLYLGRHFAIDIVGGWVFGSLFLVSVVLAVDVLRPSVAVAPTSEPATTSNAESQGWKLRPARVLTVVPSLAIVLVIVAGVFIATQADSRSYLESAFSTGSAQKLYPGSASVDWIDADGYNLAAAINGAVWTSLGGILSASCRWDPSMGNPFLVGEYGVQEGAPGEQPARFTQSDRELRTLLPGTRAVVYFDSDDKREFDGSVTASALAAFRTSATGPYITARPHCEHFVLASA